MALFIKNGKEIIGRINRFRHAQKEIAAGVERIVKGGKNFLLRRTGEVNENIATADEIEPGKGGILQQIMRGKENVLPNFRLRPVTAILFGEVALEAGRDNIFGNGGWVETTPRNRHGRFIKIGGENLPAGRFFSLGRAFGQLHRHGVSFFAGGATGHPDTH